MPHPPLRSIVSGTMRTAPSIRSGLFIIGWCGSARTEPAGSARVAKVGRKDRTERV